MSVQGNIFSSPFEGNIQGAWEVERWSEGRGGGELRLVILWVIQSFSGPKICCDLCDGINR